MGNNGQRRRRPRDGSLADRPADDVVGLYLYEIGQYPLLTPSQEAELARRVADGDAGARHRLIEGNLRLVVALARRYGSLGVPLEDLIQVGNLGLMRAATRYDGRRGVRFSTYATYWIRQAILRAVTRDSRPVRVPDYAVEMLRRDGQTLQHGDVNSAGTALRCDMATPFHPSASTLVAIRRALRMPVALDHPAGEEDEDGAVLSDIIGEDHFTQLETGLVQAAIRDEIAAALGCLSPREQRAIALCFGLGGTEPCSLAAAGQALGLSGERVRRILKEAFARMRQVLEARGARDLLAA